MLHYLLQQATGLRLEAKKEGEKTAEEIKTQYFLVSRIKGLEERGSTKHLCNLCLHQTYVFYEYFPTP